MIGILGDIWLKSLYLFFGSFFDIIYNELGVVRCYR